MPSAPRSFDILSTFRARLGENYELHAKYMNPAWAKVTRLIGYDRVYARAEGCHLWDTDGRRYLDCVSGFCVSNVGHNHPTLRRALTDVLSQPLPNLVQLDCSLLSGLLAEALVERIPWLDAVYFASSGAEAIESALKFARASSGRNRIVYAHGSYHGVTYGALSVTGHAMWREGFGALLPGVDAVPFGDAGALEAALFRRDVAGVLLEPIQVGAGVIVPPDDYLPRVAEACKKTGTLLLADEIHTGIGRTGSFLASTQWGIEPDVVCLSKGLSGGMVPVAAVVTRRRVLDRVYSRLDRSCVHASTFMGNNLAMASGLATLHVLDAEDLVARAKDAGERLTVALKEATKGFELVKDVRGRGLLLGIEFAAPRSFLLRQAWSMMHRLNPGLFAQAFTIPLLEDHSVLTQVAGHNEDVLKVAPALVVSDEDIRWLASSLRSVLARAHALPGPFWEVASRLARNAASVGEPGERRRRALTSAGGAPSLRR